MARPIKQIDVFKVAPLLLKRFPDAVVGSDENIDYENVKGVKDYISKAIKHKATRIIELEDLKTGFETIINVSDITAMQFGKVQNI